MAIKLTNNARSSLASALTNGATTLTIVSGNAGLFPSLGTDDWFPLTIVSPSGEYEIVRATARSGANITIVRAQEGTTAKAFDIGAKVDIRMTAAVVAAFFDRSSHTGTQPIATVEELPQVIESLGEADAAILAAISALATEMDTKTQNATQESDGSMSKADKKRVDGAAQGDVTIVTLTEAQYEAITPKDSKTLYALKE